MPKVNDDIKSDAYTPTAQNSVHQYTEEEPPSWVKENRGWTHEEAEAFKADVVARRNKLADMAAANESGNGLLDKRDSVT